MRVFITGVAGFLGSNLAEACIKKGHKVSGCDNLVGGELGNIKDLKLKFYKTDIEDLDKMTEIIRGVDVICHAAAYAHEGLSNVSPKFICQNNLSGSVSVFTAGIRNKVKRIVFCSSMARYGNVDRPYRESQTPKPIDPYGVSKVAAEDILKILSKTYGFEYNIAIPHNIIGPKQKFDDPFRNVVSIMVNLILQNKTPTIYGDGNQRRCFSDIDDCISCLEKLLFDENIFSETINIGPDEEPITINDLFKLIANKMQFNQPANYIPPRPNEVFDAVCSSEKARNLLGYSTKVKLDESINKVINYIKLLGPKKFKYRYEIEIKDKITPKTWSEKLF